MLCNKKTKLNLAIWLTVVALAVLTLPAAATAQDAYDLNLMDDPDMFAELRMPGAVEGMGTYFEVADSNYIDITFESTEPVHLRLESVPRMVIMDIERTEDADSTQIILGGFDPNTTYYMYEDNYHNLTELTTDESGSYSYTQDLTERHLVFIQPSRSTIFLSDSGWSNPAVGTWDSATKTATLTQDVYETIQIDSDGITLDGDGFSVTGSKTGYGVYLNQRSNVTIENLTVEGFSTGIYLYSSSNNILTGNIINSNGYGIYLYGSSNNILTGNTASDNSSNGILLGVSFGTLMRGNIMAGNRVNFNVTTFLTYSGGFWQDIDTSNTVEDKPIYYLYGESGTIYNSITAPDAGVFFAIHCDSITIRDLTVNSSCQSGIFLWDTRNSTIENITASNNQYGIYLQYSTNNTIKNCNSTNNERGIYLYESNANTLTNNTASSNKYFGAVIYNSSGNTLTGNAMSANRYNFYVAGSQSSDFVNNINTTNTVEGQPIYYVVGDSDPTIYDSTTAPDAGVFYAIDCDNITIKDLTPANNNYAGIYLWNTDNSTIENVSASNSNFGIYLTDSTNNILTGNTVNSNYQSGICLRSYCQGNDLTGNTASNNGRGIYLYDSSYNILTGNTTSGNGDWGIYLQYSANNTITDCTSTNNNRGIYLAEQSNANTLTGNITNSNVHGIYFYHNCNNNALTGNIASSNSSSGIYLYYNCNNNILTDNTANLNSYYGTYIGYSSGNTLTGNTMSANRYNFHVGGYQSSDFDHNIDAINTVEGQPIYYVVGDSDPTIYDSTTAPDAGVFYAIDCDNITIRDLTPANNNYNGVFFWNTNNSTVENVSASNGYNGIYLSQSTTNTLTGNTTSNNSYSGIYLYDNSNNNILTNNNTSNGTLGILLHDNCSNNTLICNTVSNNSRNGIYLHSNSSYNTLTGNTSSNNNTGIYLIYGSSNNTLTGNTASNNYLGIQFNASNNNLTYNNNFIGNTVQIYGDGTDNVFNLAAPTGGNYWSDWTSPDVNPEDGFVDFPYIISTYYGAQDNLPLVSPVPSICNEAPVANAGTDQSVHQGDLVTLDGSASYDPDEDPLTYSWQITSMPMGSTTELWDFDTVNPTFVADLMGDYIIELVVTDNLGAQSAADTVLVSTYNTPPVADAGEDQALLELYTTVQLGADSGRQSYDEDGDDITYEWTITQKPAESLAELSDPFSPGPNFVADVQGDYVITLVVTDNFDAVSDADTVAVNFTNVKPVADAGGSQAVIAGETVLLDGSGSSDENGDPLTYSWSFVSKPDGSLVELTDPTSVQTSFVADVPGTYIVSLVVNDGIVDSEPDNVTIEVISAQDAVVRVLLDLIDAIKILDENSLKNRNLKTPLINKVNAVLNKIERGFYDEALDKLQNDILQKTNGCAETGQPDKNDWIIACENGQNLIYPLVIQAIELLENLI